MFKFITKLFGTPSERALKKVKPYIKAINDEQEKLKNLSDEALRAKTQDLKKYLRENLKAEKDTIETLKREAEKTQDLKEKISLYAQIDVTQATYDKHEEALLMEILPTAFAIVKETSRRYASQGKLSLPMTPYDQEMAKKHAFVTIEGDTAHWSNTWEAGGQTIVWNMIPYDVQLIGGIVLHQGKVAEMKTGEGKTLASTLPIFLNALAGRGVHVVTVNDYLARRDAQWMGPIFQFHELTVDCVDNHEAYSPQRKAAYDADITYCTGSSAGFDYLRDNMATDIAEKVQRGHNYAIVDEVDSVLIDEARTPLIISGPAAYTTKQEYYDLKPLIQQLYAAQHALVVELMREAKQKIPSEDKDIKAEGGRALFRIYRALPKYKPFIQFLSQKGIKQLLSSTEDYYLQENARLMPEADEILLFTIDEKLNHISLTDKGVEYLAQKTYQPDFFVLPDIATDIAQIENNPDLSDEAKLAQKETLSQDYGIKSARLHATTQLLKAYALFEKEIDYVVLNQKVMIVDEKTGRILDGRRYSDGLHQALEAKENVKIEDPTQTYATITPQNQFRMYRKLAGMTGTADTEAPEFWEIYKLEVVVVPTHRPVIRQDHDDIVFKTHQEKLKAIKVKVDELKAANRPVLVNTTSVEASEEMRRLLGLKPTEVLNARNHAIESKIIAHAGEAGRVTIVTQMGGRGTDIKLTPESKAAGGLFVLLSEKNPKATIDNQARGRSGRQGDPGDSQAFVSLEDELIAHFRHGFIGKQMDKAFYEEGEAIQDPMITSALNTAQQRIEEQHFYGRKRSLQYDDVMNMQRVVIYGKRDNALRQQKLSLDIMNMFYNTVATIVEHAKNRQSPQHLHLELKSIFGISYDISHNDLVRISTQKLTQDLYTQALAHYHERIRSIAQSLFSAVEQLPKKIASPYLQLPMAHGNEELIATIDLPQLQETQGKAAIKAIESTVILHFIDEYWKRHLLQMDQLKEATRNVVYEQKDPLLTYKFEGLELFKKLMNDINSSTLSFLNHWEPHFEGMTASAPPQYNHTYQGMQIEEATDPDQSMAAPVERKPITTQKIANRNQRVTVKYRDGKIKESVKYKTVEDDINKGICELIAL